MSNIYRHGVSTALLATSVLLGACSGSNLGTEDTVSVGGDGGLEASVGEVSPDAAQDAVFNADAADTADDAADTADAELSDRGGGDTVDTSDSIDTLQDHGSDNGDVPPALDADADADGPEDSGAEVPDPCDQPERCNGVDDDCDGLIDEGLPGLPTRARRVIVFIADGTGFAQVQAARMYANGDTAPLSFEAFPHSGQVNTYNAVGGTTDSAAAATAMATGRKVTNSVISRALPGDGADVPTVLEAHAALGRRTGLVTTYTAATDATPAAFGAHAVTRSDKVTIAASYLQQTRPNVLMGLADAALTPAGAADAGYTVATTPQELASSAVATSDQPLLAGLFADKATSPTLTEMLTKALEVLDAEPLGFFLLVEHEGTDEGGHGNNTELVLNSLLEIEAAVAAARAWAEGKDDVLIVFTADHETGGLLVTETAPQAGVVPEMTWNTGEHTPTPVPIFAWGAGADRLMPSIDNTQVYDLIAPVERARLTQGLNSYGAAWDTTLRQGFPTGDLGASPVIVVDADEPLGSGLGVQSLIRFGELGELFDVQDESPEVAVPLATTAFVTQAHVGFNAHDAGHALALHDMLAPWTPTDSWMSLSGGVATDGVEASAASTGRSSTAGIGEIWVPVADSLRHWLTDGLDANLGWVMNPTGSLGVTMDSSEAVSGRPTLIVDYTCGVQTARFGMAVEGYDGFEVSQLSDSAGGATVPEGAVVSEPGTHAFLMRFDAVFGSSVGQVPPQAHIVSASLTWWVSEAAPTVRLHPLLGPWDSSTTWQSQALGGDGVQADGLEAGVQADGTSAAAEGPGRRTLDLSAAVRRWQSAPSQHHGWVALADGAEASVSVDADAGATPVLAVTYVP